MFDGFTQQAQDTGAARIHYRMGGDGPPLLLLHGYPQTHVMWHPIAGTLAERFTVIAADLRGYGASRAENGDMTFRAMAADMVALMASLGHDSFHVLAHDRGARTAHRMALDAPGAVRSVALLDILPTLDVWAHMDAFLARKYWHWPFLAQPGELPERLLRADPLSYLNAALTGLSGGASFFHPEALSAYEAAAKDPETTDAWVADYRAAANEDLAHDRADLGRTLEIPACILWGTKGVVAHHVDPLEAWQTWFPEATGQGIEAGHFLVEEAPAATLTALSPHLDSLT